MKDLPTIEQLMGLIEADIHGYFYTIDLESDQELRFKRNLGWQIRKRNEGEFETFTTNQVIEVLNKKMFDLLTLHTELFNTVTLSAHYYTRRLDSVKNVLGEDTYQEGVRVWDEFGDTLRTSVDNMVRKSKIQLVKGE